MIREIRWRISPPQNLDEWAEERLQTRKTFWVFLTGCNNSGTTLLKRLLAEHPNIRSLPSEGQRLTTALPLSVKHKNATRNFTIRPDIFRWTEADDPAPARRARYDWAYYYRLGPGLLLDQSPHHSLRVRWLQANFLPSRFIWMSRSPYAVCEGIRRRNGHAIDVAARHWLALHQYLLDDLPYLDQALWIKHEDLCASPLQQLGRVQSFLGFSEAFDTTLATATHSVHNLDSQPSPIRDFNPKSLERLSAADINTISDIAGPMMEQLGYETIMA